MQVLKDEEILDFIFNPTGSQLVGLPVPEITQTTECNGVDEETNKKIKEIELSAIKEAENGEIDKAIALFTEALQLAPNNASVLNNRAQALRLKGDVDAALQDLDKAIELSVNNPFVAKQAYTQRGLIKELREQDEEARKDFEIAAKLGSQFSAKEAVRLNPYARLCNQMLKEAMKEQQYS